MDPFSLVFLPTFGAGCVLGATLAWKASGRGLIGQTLLLLLAVAAVWLSLILGVCWGYDAWQSLPEPPDEAFADGANLTGSVMFGWMPAGAGCAVVFFIGHVMRHRRNRPRP